MRCSEKKAYSKRDAQTARNAQERRTATPLSIYECPECGRWHLTSHPKRPRRY